MLGPSLENSILVAVRQSGVAYREALSVIRDSRLENPTKKQLIRANTDRGRLLQRLFSLGSYGLVPDPQEDGWIYKGPSSYARQMESYSKEAEVVLRRLIRFQTCLSDRIPSENNELKES